MNKSKSYSVLKAELEKAKKNLENASWDLEQVQSDYDEYESLVEELEEELEKQNFDSLDDDADDEFIPVKIMTKPSQFHG